MKKMIISGVVASAISLLAPQTAHCQGTIYVSGLGQPSAGSVTVASDSWQAVLFGTGNNPGGYALDSIQLAMLPGAGAPTSFTVMLYSLGNTLIPPIGPGPESSLGTLSGSADPVAGGVFTYTASDITLSPSTTYSIVITSGIPMASGAYAWSVENTANPTSSSGWGVGYDAYSGNGLTWTPESGPSGVPQFSVTATAVPEPETLGALGLAGLLFLAWRHWPRQPHLQTNAAD